MIGLIPCIRVNYTISLLLKALFVSKNKEYKKELVELLESNWEGRYVFLTSSGRNALYLLLKHLPQNKVLIPSYTCEVVAYAAMKAGKTIVYDEINEETLNSDYCSVINEETIVIATHQYGLPCDIERISKVCKNKGAILIEDCAGALGSTVNNKLMGSYGDYAIFSFNASKTIQSPSKGGFLLSKDKAIIEEIKRIDSFDQDDWKFRLKQLLKSMALSMNNNRICCWIISKFVGDSSSKQVDADKALADEAYLKDFYEWQAFVTIGQIKKLPDLEARRQSMMKEYNEGIHNDLIAKPLFDRNSVNIRYAVLVNERNRFVDYCKKHHVQVGQGYRELICPESFNVAHGIGQKIVYLPFGSNYTIKEIKYIIKVVNSYK